MIIAIPSKAKNLCVFLYKKKIKYILDVKSFILFRPKTKKKKYMEEDSFKKIQQHHHHTLLLPEEEEEEDAFLEEDLEGGSSKTVNFEIIREYGWEEENAVTTKDVCAQVVRPGTACAMVGTVILFAVAYGIIVLLDTKLSTPLDMLLAFVCAMSGLICFCVMRYCSARAQRQKLRRTKHKHSIQMRRIKTSSSHVTHPPDTSLASLSQLIQKQKS